MKVKTTITTAALAIAVLSTGCTVTKTLQPTSGSKSDGNVKMTYNKNILENPEPDLIDAQEKASAMCTNWGYDSAERFAGQQETCMNGNCSDKQVTITYQCTNDEN